MLGGRDYIGPALLVRVRRWPRTARHVGQAAGWIRGQVGAEGCVGIVRAVAVVRGVWARVASSAVEAMVVMSEAGVRAQGTAGWRSRDRLVGLDWQKD